MSPASLGNRSVAAVSGAGGGIGRAIAQRLAADGYAVAAIDVDAAAAAETVGSLAGNGLPVAADVSDAEQVEAAMRSIHDELGAVDVLVNGAGIFDQNLPLIELAHGSWDRILAVNVTGAYLMTKAALSSMVPRRTGVVVNVASTAGLAPRGGGAAYVASKYAVVGMTKKVAAEVAESGVRVNAVAPGWVPTGLFDTSAVALRAADAEFRDPGDPSPGGDVPMGRPGDTDEVAAAVAFLASSDASYITGIVLPVDGGHLLT